MLSEAGYRREMNRLFDGQPRLTATLLEAGRSMPREAHARIVDTFILLLAIFDEAYPGGVAEVSEDEMAAVLERDKRHATEFASGRAPFRSAREREVLDFIVQEMEPEDDSVEAASIATASVFVLKAVLECLTDAAARLRQGPVSVPAPKADRNDPCPCGSGRKYKKCCLTKETEARVPARSPFVELEQELLDQIEKFAQRSDFLFDDGLLDEIDPSNGLFDTLAGWYVPSGGRSLADHFFEARGGRLSPRLRAWFEAQRAAWLSIWEITAVEPGVGLTLRDLLSGETRVVRETKASTIVEPRQAMLARVVELEGSHQLFGLHFQPLEPLDVAPIVARWKRKFGRARARALEKLRGYASVRALTLWWDDAAAELEALEGLMPEMRNTSGDPMLFTRERFVYDPADRQLVVARLGALYGVDVVTRAGRPLELVLCDGDPETAPEGSLTMLARIEVGERELLVETNSVRRADDARATIEKALGTMVRRGLRDHVDPATLMDGADAPAPAERDDDAPELDEAVRRTVKAHYATWPDVPLPALRGKSPREAARTKAGREKVVALLKTFELDQAKMPEAARFDVRDLYTALGIDYD